MQNRGAYSQHWRSLLWLCKPPPPRPAPEQHALQLIFGRAAHSISKTAQMPEATAHRWRTVGGPGPFSP